MRRAPGFPLPRGGTRASPPLWAAGAASGAADPAAARRHPAGFHGGLHAAEPPPPLRLPCSSLRPAAVAPSRTPGERGSAPAAAAPKGLILSPIRRVPRPLALRSARPRARRSTSGVLSGAAGPRLRHGILPLSRGGIVPPRHAFFNNAVSPSTSSSQKCLAKKNSHSS
jgi:hypothetical protein